MPINIDKIDELTTSLAIASDRPLPNPEVLEYQEDGTQVIRVKFELGDDIYGFEVAEQHEAFYERLVQSEMRAIREQLWRERVYDPDSPDQ